MTPASPENLQYPIGRFKPPTEYTPTYLTNAIIDLETFPKRLKEVVSHLNNEQLNTIYRPGGWTVRQVIHHCAESHMNCFIRIKWALTESTPLIKTYDENLWSNLSDNLNMPIEPSLVLLEGLHQKLVFLLTNLSLNQLECSYQHPETGLHYNIKYSIGSYAWHCNHHLAHITSLKARNHW